MTEVVTIKVAQDAQQNLFAQRPQVIRDNQNDQTPIQITHAEVEPDVRRAATSSELGGQDNGGGAESAFRQRDSRAELSGPSRARIVLRDFDLGKTPAEVVGTQDVVLRFDSNSDGRIDLIESQRSARARSDTGGSSFRGLGAPAYDNETTPAAPEVANPRPQATLAPVPASGQTPGDAKARFGTTEDGTVIELKKYVDPESGQPTGAAPQKYFGKGAEAAVVGQFAAPSTDTAQKFADRAPQTDRGTATESASGESKYYDKVAEAETDANAGDETESQPQSYYDRAQTVAADTAETVTEAPPAKKYTNLPGYTLTAPAPQSASDIHIQVTA